jgi:formimidoylglutamate deiminase
MSMTYLAPDYVLTPQGWLAAHVVVLDEQGRIAALIGREQADQLPREQAIEELRGVALLPGFVNVHSHVFQRALRGHTQRSLERRDTFWTWRRAMYTEAQRLQPESLYSVALATYREMLAAGYTAVGEFHYVHHQPDGRPYAPVNAMAEALLEAARAAGIRLVLLMSAYARAGFGRAAAEEQRRFCDPAVEVYLERVELLREAGVAVGVAPHSVRAVPEDWLCAIAAYSQRYALPLHVHADEQPGEIEECLAAHGCRPLELLDRCGVLSERTTVVHATHADRAEIELLARAGAGVCLCPTTEGDLGDGIAPYAELLAQRIPLTIGSDSNTRLDPFEELRWAEYSARMRYLRRRVLVAAEETSPGTLLLACGTEHGAAALGMEDAGRIHPGALADLVAIDLTSPALSGWTPGDLLDCLIFGASAAVVKAVWVAGQRVYMR